MKIFQDGTYGIYVDRELKQTKDLENGKDMEIALNVDKVCVNLVALKGWKPFSFGVSSLSSCILDTNHGESDVISRSTLNCACPT